MRPERTGIGDATSAKTIVPHGNVAFTVVNAGKIAHDFSISGKTTPLVSPGKTTGSPSASKSGPWSTSAPFQVTQLPE
jgi:hypothetical protein